MGKRVMAGDTDEGRLCSLGGSQYEGERRRDGRLERERMAASSLAEAIERWRAWQAEPEEPRREAYVLRYVAPGNEADVAVVQDRQTATRVLRMLRAGLEAAGTAGDYEARRVEMWA